MTHVGLNLVFAVPGETGGTETYARALVPALAHAAAARASRRSSGATPAASTSGSTASC
jgi:hypothetical protein